MNWNAIRSLLDVIALGLTFLSAGLLGLGCTDTAGKISCDAATVPVEWVPILVVVAAIATFGRMIAKALTGAGGLFGKDA